MPGPVSSEPLPTGNSDPSVIERFRRFWVRRRALFWNLHSMWALTAGGLVIFLAHERFGFVPWVILFLILTWVSTFVFSRTIGEDNESFGQAELPALRREVASYLTRVMYQGTLFFLLPFYWYSTVLPSPNLVFSALLVGLAILSCLDVVFDQWLRTRPLFGVFYFATVTFAAINLILPILLPFAPDVATPLAALAAVGSAIPLAVRGSLAGRFDTIWLGLLAVFFLFFVVVFPRFVPPVPMRLRNTTFTSYIDKTTLAPADRFGSNIRASQLPGALFILGEIFAPSTLPTSVWLEWKRDGEQIRTSREIAITAHDQGFRLWDAYRPSTGEIMPGMYEVVFQTSGNRILGVAVVNVSPE